ncbi:hypothetical protein ACHAWF_004986 [Thalassiosira exigua]
MIRMRLATAIFALIVATAIGGAGSTAGDGIAIQKIAVSDSENEGVMDSDNEGEMESDREGGMDSDNEGEMDSDNEGERESKGGKGSFSRPSGSRPSWSRPSGSKPSRPSWSKPSRPYYVPTYGGRRPYSTRSDCPTDCRSSSSYSKPTIEKDTCEILCSLGTTFPPLTAGFVTCASFFILWWTLA